ncbi:MAG: ferritin family protein [Thermodesulfovibrionales bacterium]
MMITGKEDIIQALIEAYLMEKGTMEFYAHASDKALNPDARETFSMLSEWEKKHMEYIQFLYQSFTQDLDIIGFERFRKRMPAPIIEAGIPVKELESKTEKYSFTDDMGALSLSLEIEGKAYNLYRMLSEKAVDTNTRVIFEEMMEQELKHIEYLRDLRERLFETRYKSRIGEAK